MLLLLNVNDEEDIDVRKKDEEVGVKIAEAICGTGCDVGTGIRSINHTALFQLENLRPKW